MIHLYRHALSFLLIVTLLVQGVGAQDLSDKGPGGIKAAVWYRPDGTNSLFSDNGTTPVSEGGSIQQWNDAYGSVNNLVQTTAANKPTYSKQTTQINFHPTVSMTRAAFMAFTPASGTKVMDRSQGTMYAFGLPTANTTSGIMGFGAALNQPGMHFSSNTPQSAFNNTYTLSTETHALNLPFVAGLSWQNGASNTSNTFSFNGVRTTFQTANVNTTTVANEILRVGHSSRTNGLTGILNEVVVFNRKLTTEELNKVDSYFALKYGVPLKGQINYVSGNGTTIWNRANNQAYSNNIAGIGYDPQADLHQKQAWSTTDATPILIGTTGLQNSNTENTVAIAPNQFLLWGDNGKAKKPTVSMPRRLAVNYRMEAIWKVQNTNQVGTVRIAWPKNNSMDWTLLVSSDEIFDGQDAQHPMTHTITIQGITYSYVDVTLADGVYFTLATTTSAPGGVMPAVWYRSDADAKSSTVFSDNGTTAAEDKQGIAQWNDFYQSEFSLTPEDISDKPIFSDKTTLNNFHPTVNFTDDPMTTSTTTANRIINRSDNGSIVAAGKVTVSSTSQFVTGFGLGARSPGLTIYNNFPRGYINATSSTQAPDKQRFNENDNFSMAMAWNIGTSNQVTGQFSADGIRVPMNPTGTMIQTTAHDHLHIGGATSYTYTGQVNEVAVFEHVLNTDEFDRVESYMAIKYGSSKNYANGTKNYLNSNSEVIWDANRNAAFRYNIAGIARDDKGGLNQKQAWSTHSANEILIGTLGLANNNGENQVRLERNQFLLWGDNGKPKKPTFYMVNRAAEHINFRFEAIWKVQNTNQVGTVRVAWPRSNRNFSLLQSNDPTFENIQTITPMDQIIRINGKEYIYADVLLQDNTYFTLGMHGLAPGGVLRGLSHWYRADQALTVNGPVVTAWQDLISATQATQINQAPLPTMLQGSTTHLNFNPSVQFTSTQQMLGNLSVLSLDSTHFDIVSVVKENNAGNRFFSIGRIDSTGNAVANWAHPALHTNGRVIRKSNLDKQVYNGIPRTPATDSPSILLNRFTTTSTSAALNGNSLTTPAMHDTVGIVQGGHIIGANNGDAEGFTGHIAELFVFGEGSLAEEDRTKIETYLAIKYGVTLQNRKNYVSAKDIILWNGTDNATYGYNVAGIGAEEVSILAQKQSRSQQHNTNGQVVMAVGSLAANNLQNTAIIPDGQYLLWGDNNNKTAMSNNATTYANVRYLGRIQNGRRMQRVWKVQNTGLTQQVDIRFPVASVGTTTLVNDDCAINAIVFAKDAAFTEDVTFVAVNTVGDDYQANYSFPEGALYFSFARIVPSSEAHIHLPYIPEVSNEYDSGFCVGEWIYFNKAGQQEQKIIALYGYIPASLTSATVHINPTGTTFNGNTVTTKLMPRITTLKGMPSISNARTTAQDSTIVRVFYSQAELNATHFTNYQSAGWYFYHGDDAAVLADLADDGLLEPSVAQAITVARRGTEDGVAFVEFDNAPANGSFVYIATTNSTALPVTFAYFTARVMEQQVLLNWTTTQEVNNNYFEIERSTDAQVWQSIGTVLAQEGVAQQQLRAYSFTDRTPLTKVTYYRLKQVDKDGTVSYSRMQSVVAKDKIVNIQLSPNPVSEGWLKLKIDVPVAHIRILNLNGNVVSQPTVDNDGIIQLHNMPAGVYLLSVTTYDHQTFVKTFVIK